MIVVIALAGLAISAIRNKKFEWHVVWHYLFAAPILTGVVHTVELTVISMVGATILGVILAGIVLSDNWLLAAVAKGYLSIIRSTPILVQLLVWYYLAAVYPRAGLGIPFGGPTFASLNANSLVTQSVRQFWA